MLHAGAISIPKHAKLIQEMEKLSYDGKRVDHLPQYSKDCADGVAGVVRAIATGLAKPTDDFNFTFCGNELFGDFSGLEGQLGQVVLPPDVVPGSEGFLANSWGM